MCTVYGSIDTIFVMENERNRTVVPDNREYTEKKRMVRQKLCPSERNVTKMGQCCKSKWKVISPSRGA